MPGAVAVNNANQKVQPALVVTVDRARAADLGITSQAAAGALRTAVGGVVVGKYRQPGQDDVIVGPGHPGLGRRIAYDPAGHIHPGGSAIAGRHTVFHRSAEFGDVSHHVFILEFHAHAGYLGRVLINRDW